MDRSRWCTISLHPFVVRQPFRLRLLRKAPEHRFEHPRRKQVGWTRHGEIAQNFRPCSSSGRCNRGSRPVPPAVRYPSR
jgi:hypothetical protein